MLCFILKNTAAKGKKKNGKFDSKIGQELKNLVIYSSNSVPNLLLRKNPEDLVQGLG